MTQLETSGECIKQNDKAQKRKYREAYTETCTDRDRGKGKDTTCVVKGKDIFEIDSET